MNRLYQMSHLSIQTNWLFRSH